MNRTLKIIIYNLILLCFIFVIFEVLHDIYRLNVKYNKVTRQHSDYAFKKRLYLAARELFSAYIQNENFYNVKTFRAPFVVKNNKPAILLVGCSYTYGDRIKNEETLAAHLSKALNTTVYNMGLNGGSPREMLYMFTNTSVLDEYTKKDTNINTVIYTFIDDHVRRLYNDSRPRVPRYKYVGDDTLVYLGPTLHSELVQSMIFDKLPNWLPLEKKYRLFNVYMINIYAAIKHKYGENTEFVILVYDERQLENPNWKELEDKGIKIIKIKEIISEDMFQEEYLADDGYHPNVHAWDIITPKLTERL